MAGPLEFYKTQIIEAFERIENIKSGSVWVQKHVNSDVLAAQLEDFDKHISQLEKDCAFCFSSTDDTAGLTVQNVDLFRKWVLTGDAPHLAAIALYAVDQFGMNLRADESQALITAALLGEIPNSLKYHNNMHYRKVLTHVIRMIAAHNHIYEGTKRALDQNDMLLLMIAACIHDLAHDGLGNVVQGVFEQGRLELLAFLHAEPYLKAAGLSDSGSLEALKILLLATDVSPLNDKTNLMSQMKAAYRYHFMGEYQRFNAINLDPPLEALHNNPRLTEMALLLHEADIATSAGLSYAMTKYETTLFRAEIGKDDACSQHVVDFLHFVCGRKMLSDAGQKLYAANLARIYALAEEGFRNGNDPFPPVEHSEFLSSLGTDRASYYWNTVN